MNPKEALQQIQEARTAVFTHCKSEDHWGELSILDGTMYPWFMDSDLSMWPEGYKVTDPNDDPDYSSRSEELESPHLMVGPRYTLAVGVTNGQKLLWLLDNELSFKEIQS